MNALEDAKRKEDLDAAIKRLKQLAVECGQKCNELDFLKLQNHCKILPTAAQLDSMRKMMEDSIAGFNE